MPVSRLMRCAVNPCQTPVFFQKLGRGRSGSDPPPEGGCPRHPHEFSCSRTPQRKGGRPQVRCPRSATPPRLRYTAARCEVPRDAKPQTRPARASPGSAAGLRKWLHHSPRTLVHIPQSGPRALGSTPFEQPRVKGPLRAGTVGSAPPQAGKTKEALFTESPSLRFAS